MSKADKDKFDAELLLWAAGKIRVEQERGTYGTITFQLEAGTIVRSETKVSDKPPTQRA